MTTLATMVWENVVATGSNIDVVSAQQYLRVSGKTLFRRLLVIFAAMFVFGAGLTYGGYQYLKDREYEQTARRGLETLRARVLPRAFYDSAVRIPYTFENDCDSKPRGYTGAPKCYPGTRLNILDEIYAWSNCTPSTSSACSPIFWLHTPYRMGKSAITQAMSERWSNEGLLAASYMFFAESFSGDELWLTVPTLSYQLQRSVGGSYGSRLGTNMIKEPSILTASIPKQAEMLIHRPLTESLTDHNESFWLRMIRWLSRSEPPPTNVPRPDIIVIDGLDRILEPEHQRHLLDILAPLVFSTKPPFRLFVSSRPSPAIQEAMNDLNKYFNESINTLELENDKYSIADMNHYIRSEFTRILKSGRIPWLPGGYDWPGEDTIRNMIESYGGRFDRANFAMNCIGAAKCNPIWTSDRCLIMADHLPSIHSYLYEELHSSGQIPLI